MLRNKQQASNLLASAVKYHNAGCLSEAEELYRLILQSDPDHPDHPAALHHLGLISYQNGETEIAIDLIGRAIEKNPNVPVFYYNLGLLLADLGKTGEAIIAYRQALRLKPDYAEALNNLGLILFDEDRIEASIVLFQEAIRINQDFTNAHYNLGNAFQYLVRPESAIKAFNQVLKILPDSAETRFNRSLSLLLNGNFKEGWVEYEWRFRETNTTSDSSLRNRSLRWDGSSFAGKRLFVHDEQGIGDTLQFIRYLPMVKTRGGTVIFETIKSLTGLLQNFPGVDELTERSSAEKSSVEFDLFVPLMSLPGIFGTTLETIPAGVPYIHADSIKAGLWCRQLVGNGFKVGIVWAGKQTNEYDRYQSAGMERVDLAWAGKPASKTASSRSVRLEYFSPIYDIPGVRLFGLQKGEAVLQAEELSGVMNVTNFGEELKDFSDTTALIENLDLVISIDTAVAHLAGAMGKAVWVLLPFAPDWRWMLNRKDSPWYPTMRLFRQRKRNNWDEVFEEIADELRLLVSQ